MGKNIVAGRGITLNPGEPYAGHGFFYALLIGLTDFVVRDLEFSGHLVSILGFALTVIPLFFLVRKIYPGYAAHWVSLLYVTNGFLLAWSHVIMPETIFTFLVVLLIYLVHEAIQPGDETPLRQGLGVGAVAGLAYLTRPEGLFFYLVSALAVLLLSAKPLGLRLRVLLSSLPPFLLFLLPHIYSIYQTSGQLQLSIVATQNLILRQMMLSPRPPDEYLEVKKIYYGLTDDKKRLKIEELKEGFDPIRYLVKDNFALIRPLYRSFAWPFYKINLYLFGGLGFFLIGASWLSTPWEPKRKRSELMFLLFLSTFLLHLFGIFLPKRYFPYFPVYLIWMGNGIEVLRHWAERTFVLTLQRAFGVALGSILFFTLLSAYYLQRNITQAPLPLENKEMGLWMKRNIPGIENERVASRHPSVNFYSGSKILDLPYVDRLQDLLTFLRHQGAPYFVISEDLDHPFIDTYGFLLDDKTALSPGILRRHSVKGNQKMVLFEVLNQS